MENFWTPFLVVASGIERFGCPLPNFVCESLFYEVTVIVMETTFSSCILKLLVFLFMVQVVWIWLNKLGD